MKHLYTAFALLITASLYAQPIIGFQPLVTGLNNPVDLVAEPGSSRMFVIEQSGLIKIWNGSSVLSTPFLDLSSKISYSGDERGLLSMVFHPQYLSNRYFFVWYTNLSSAVTLARYKRDAANPDVADPSSGVVLLTISKNFANHNGAKLNFGPDGYLYIGTGDGGGANDPSNNAQNGSSLLGKILRLDVNRFATTAPYYDIPPANPYINDPNVADEILALGLRNPWRWSFDKATGDMWIADVGQDAWEEVNFQAAANISNPGNYGWRCLEGAHPSEVACAVPANYIAPVFDYPHNLSGGYVVTGGYVYRGAEYTSLQGYYIMVDFAYGNGWLIKPNGGGGWNITAQTGWPTHIATFGEKNDGTLYAAGNGTIYKVTATAPLPIQLLSFTGRKSINQHELTWEVQQEKKGNRYIVERSLGNQMNFIEVATNTAISDNNFKRYDVSIPATLQPTYYRLKTMQISGNMIYSSIVFMNTAFTAEIKAIKNSGNIVVESNSVIKQLIISDVSGRIFYTKYINASGMISVPLYNLPKGILLVKVVGETESRTIKVVN